MDIEKLQKSLEQARDVAEAIGMRTNLEFFLSSRRLLENRYGGNVPQENGSCVRPWLYTYVTVHGDVLPCPRYAYHSGESLGNLFRQSFPREIWNGDSYRKLRADLRAHRPGWEQCRDCPVPAEEGGLLSRLRRRGRVP